MPSEASREGGLSPTWLRATDGKPISFASPSRFRIGTGVLYKKILPGQHRREAPFFIAPVAQLSERSPPKAVVVGDPAHSDLLTGQARMHVLRAGAWERQNGRV